MSRKKITILSLVGSVVVIIVAVVLWYILSLGSVGGDKKEVAFQIQSGTGSATIISELKNANLIKNELSAKIYVKLKGLTLKAGTYQLNREMSAKEIFSIMHEGRIENVSITFIEGKRLSSYVKQISSSFGYEEEKIMETLSDKTYLKELIKKYWFLTDDILNEKLYYPLEGYLFPDTYLFKSNASIKSIIEKMLDTMALRLKDYKEEILASDYSTHQYLAMASIIELEAVSKEDREKVSSVIYNRLAKNMSLGMDVTTYYAVKKDMGEDLYQSELNQANPYNTRGPNMNGLLPVGPICNPSIMSIIAAIKPAKTDYLYFFADVNTGKVTFTKTYNEHTAVSKD